MAPHFVTGFAATVTNCLPIMHVVGFGGGADAQCYMTRKFRCKQSVTTGAVVTDCLHAQMHCKKLQNTCLILDGDILIKTNETQNKS